MPPCRGWMQVRRRRAGIRRLTARLSATFPVAHCTLHPAPVAVRTPRLPPAPSSGRRAHPPPPSGPLLRSPCAPPGSLRPPPPVAVRIPRSPPAPSSGRRAHPPVPSGPLLRSPPMGACARSDVAAGVSPCLDGQIPVVGRAISSGGMVQVSDVPVLWPFADVAVPARGLSQRVVAAIRRRCPCRSTCRRGGVQQVPVSACGDRPRRPLRTTRPAMDRRRGDKPREQLPTRRVDAR